MSTLPNDPEYVAKALQDFKKRDWHGKRFTDVVNDFRATFKMIPFYPIHVKKGTILFRGRKNDEIKYPIFNELKEISIKDNSNGKTLGRAHIPGQSVFYCSCDEVTVVREVTQWYINDTGRAQDLFTRGIFDINPFTCFITISAWLVTEDLKLALLFSPNDLTRSPEIQQFARERFIVEPDDSEMENKCLNLIIDFFSNEFAKQDVKHDSEYLNSAYYAFEVFHDSGQNHQGSKYDGVQYVSVANAYKGENIALSKESFEKKIRFLGANFCYCYNSYEKKIDGDRDAIFGRSQAAKMNVDETFQWIDYTGEFDYLFRNDNHFEHIVLPTDGSTIPKAIIRISE